MEAVKTSGKPKSKIQKKIEELRKNHGNLWKRKFKIRKNYSFGRKSKPMISIRRRR